MRRPQRCAAATTRAYLGAGDGGLTSPQLQRRQMSCSHWRQRPGVRERRCQQIDQASQQTRRAFRAPGNRLEPPRQPQRGGAGPGQPKCGAPCWSPPERHRHRHVLAGRADQIDSSTSAVLSIVPHKHPLRRAELCAPGRSIRVSSVAGDASCDPLPDYPYRKFGQYHGKGYSRSRWRHRALA